jgi:protein O-GlcNAc transferase
VYVYQEFIGTTGATYIQYLITDKVASPNALQYLYSEKFIYMPNTFLANSMAYLSPHIVPPVLKRDVGTAGGAGGGGGEGRESGVVAAEKTKAKSKSRKRQKDKDVKEPVLNNPALNGCGGLPADFVYCNFNKHLKFSPDVFRSWLTILQVK